MYLHKTNVGSVVSHLTAINDLIREKNIFPVDLERVSTVDGTQYDLIEYLEQIKVIQKIQEFIKKKLHVDTFPVSAWSVIGEKGTYHLCHKHNDNDDICTVLYLTCPESTSFTKGAIYFLADNSLHEHCPKDGDLIVFPANMYHGTYPQKDGIRQTLNVDFKRI